MNRGPAILLSLVLACTCVLSSGCQFLLPEVSVQPLVHNPFPQLSRVAVTPFINLSDEPTVDGVQFAMAYFAELQSVRGFEVVPLGVTENAIIQLGLFRHPEEAAADARRLAQHLGVDAVVVGAVTDFDPYYPPRCGMRVEWYSANAGFHPIPAGYGLPWGTPEEEYIPESLVFEAEMALAREQLATQTPDCPVESLPLHGPPTPGELAPMPPGLFPSLTPTAPAPTSDPADAQQDDAAEDDVKVTAYEAPLPDGATTLTPGTTATADTAGAAGMFPPDWPDARGFMPPCPSPVRPACVPSDRPVMTHTKVYHGHDPEFTAALASYVDFRDDARFGGWQAYLQRSDDFIRFCAHLHIAEMLTARGGGGESRVVRRWSESR
ncbi:hypothetical protein Pla123a_01130 [Posidoniimonas polymericola]|uniref:Uncharacterized protein n=1 Tax=Posidoniimonas polymericola TaxID=2528002 RepID=A0A5C5ZDT5_9BACT|nr:hypothetical protein [Posidoniimonas polymericola]TWT85306.1 hypothetical protein Pla123a_01130 [Posidoniimonas polymericola]